MTRVAYDPEVVAGLARFAALAGPTLAAAAIPFARRGIAATVAGLDPVAMARAQGVSARDVEVPGDDTGPALVATVLTPPAPVGRSAAVLAVHGGGMVMGHRLEDIDTLIEVCARFGVPVVTFDYRLAPEEPFPAAADDALRVWRWLQQAGPSFGIDPERIVLAGTSAGGGIAAGLALRLRDRGERAPAALQLLAPMLDDRNTSASSRAYVGTSAWDHGSNEVGWTALLGPDRTEVSPYASPARAEDLAGLPPVYLEVGSAEVFRDEVVAFAERIWSSGGTAELHVWAGAFHGFERFAAASRVAQAARAARLSWLDRQLRAPAEDESDFTPPEPGPERPLDSPPSPGRADDGRG